MLRLACSALQFSALFGLVDPIALHQVALAPPPRVRPVRPTGLMILTIVDVVWAVSALVLDAVLLVGAAIQSALFALFGFRGFAVVGDKLGITEIRALRELLLRKLGPSSGA